jgi:hypothetical protein
MSRAPGSTLGIRWTLGDVSAEGFDALRLSILGAHRIFGATHVILLTDDEVLGGYGDFVEVA